MGTYYIPRDVKGEGRILFIFSTKSLIYFMVGGGIGLLFYFLFSAIGLTIVGIVIAAVFALLGFAVATVRIPEVTFLKFTHKVSGEKLDDIIVRAIKFKKKSAGKVYVYKKEEEENAR